MGKAIIIPGANFSQNAIDGSQPQDTQVYGLVLGVSINQGATPANAVISKADRANAMATAETSLFPVTWGSSVPAACAGYSYIGIPDGATSVIVRGTNTAYKFGLVLSAEGSTNHLFDSGWQNGGSSAQVSVNLASYPTAKFIQSTLALISGASFTNETLESVGWSIEFIF